MIEYRLKPTSKYWDTGWGRLWSVIDGEWEIQREDFEGYDFAINGTVFEEWTDEFTAKLMWFKLGEKNGYDCTE